MPPIRFLHAAGLDPDGSLSRSRSANAVLYDAAPLTAIERLVTHAIELQVDFLLVSPAGDAVGETVDLGLRSIAAVRREFSRLVNHAIPVALSVGAKTSAWAELANRETTVSVVPAGESLTITDTAGHARARLHAFESMDDVKSTAGRLSGGGLSQAAEIAIVPRHLLDEQTSLARSGFDYIGFGAGPRRSLPGNASLAHAPGAIQAHSSWDCGPHGATLVTVGNDGEVQTEFVPLATVRYEAITLSASPGLAIEDLADLMTRRLSGLRSEPGEVVWNLRWTIETGGALFETLSDSADRATLVGLLPDSIGQADVEHRIQVVPNWQGMLHDDPFSAGFAAALSEVEHGLADFSRRSTLAAIPHDSARRTQLAQLVEMADVDAVLSRARRIGVRMAAEVRDGDDG